MDSENAEKIVWHLHQKKKKNPVSLYHLQFVNPEAETQICHSKAV